MRACARKKQEEFSFGQNLGKVVTASAGPRPLVKIRCAIERSSGPLGGGRINANAVSEKRLCEFGKRGAVEKLAKNGAAR